jgi:hypothetical protein
VVDGDVDPGSSLLDSQAGELGQVVDEGHTRQGTRQRRVGWPDGAATIDTVCQP